MLKAFIKNHKKMFVCAVVVLVIAALFGMDIIISKTYTLKLESISEEVVYADNKIPVTVQISLTQFGKPIAGHSLYAVAEGGGRMKANRVMTDENGIAEFIYVPYTANRFMPAAPVTIKVIDESNSLVFEVNATVSVTLELVEKEDA